MAALTLCQNKKGPVASLACLFPGMVLFGHSGQQTSVKCPEVVWITKSGRHCAVLGLIAGLTFQTPSDVHCINATASVQSLNFLPAKNFSQLLRVTHKRSCTSAGNAQVQLYFRDDQQMAFGISKISHCCFCFLLHSKLTLLRSIFFFQNLSQKVHELKIQAGKLR